MFRPSNTALLLIAMFTLFALPTIGRAQTAVPFEITQYFINREVGKMVDAQEWHMELPTAPGSIAGPVDGVVVETVGNLNSSLVTQVIFRLKFPKQDYLLAEILQKRDATGAVVSHTLINDWTEGYLGNTLRDSLTAEQVLAPLWIYSQTFNIRIARNELISEPLIKTGDQMLNLLFFTWQGLKDLVSIIEDFDREINEALKYRDSINTKTEEGLFMAKMLDLWIEQGLVAREAAVWQAKKALGGRVVLDVLTWAPEKVLKPLSLVWHGVAGLAGKSAIARVTAELANTARLKAMGAYEKVIARPFTRIGVKLGIYALKAKTAYRLALFKEYFAGFKMVKAIEEGIRAGKFEGMRKFFEPAILRCGFKDPTTGLIDIEKRRLWLLSLVYGIPVGLTVQYLQRGDHFLQEFDRVIHDTGVSVFNSMTWGRCSADFDKVRDMTMFERWRQRQFYQHLNNYTDTLLTYGKLRFDGDGFTDADRAELRRRYVANFAYTLTKGPFIAAVTGERNGEMNSIYREHIDVGDQKRAMEVAATEFITRFGNSLFSWQAFVKYREGNARPEALEQQRREAERGAYQLLNSLEQMKEGVEYTQMMSEVAPESN